MEIANQPHPVDEMLPFGTLLTYGLQHMLAMYAGAVAVPLMVAHGLGLSQSQLIYRFFDAGLDTMLYLR